MFQPNTFLIPRKPELNNFTGFIVFLAYVRYKKKKQGCPKEKKRY